MIGCSRPFILATTSVGQEGLNFHRYCHEVYHWNIPSNPVDLEQREGRVHRYKGHVIRRNVASRFGLPQLKAPLGKQPDPWECLFKLALDEREPHENDLVPYWIYEKGEYRVLRHVSALPLSREREQLRDLLTSLASYRMVFGQARQQDLVNMLKGRLKNTLMDRTLRLSD